MTETETETGRKSNSTQDLPQPLRAAASVLSKVPEAVSRVPEAVSKVPEAVSKVPGAGTVGRAAEGALDKVGAVSPRGRRLAVYTGAGVLGVAGVVEWPVAVAGAAVAWLTQPRPHQRTEAGAEHGTARRTDGGAAAGDAGDASATPPTPKVLATAPARPSAAERAAQGTPAERTAAPATPSDRLPSHHAAAPQRAGRGAEGQ
ncbi:hypothetical protein P1P75_05040 [Streptomyces sp. ID05-39B]|uniref:hypothetical protein n=1 Tax=Streptomyces sp. ID05-39B TaxID=3028664 RepID=UPI0029A52C71|nr:hypothetical protein [Streptomyces sp. ID05-39B]MDX3525814.1 hypothetical protein [Streptomyces sp. ID05-39B]MDX3525815.1 hypothetical protein [Streptomyces sp. ID05-39B]